MYRLCILGQHKDRDYDKKGESNNSKRNEKKNAYDDDNNNCSED